MPVQQDSRDTFDRLAGECDELKLRAILGYRQAQNATTLPIQEGSLLVDGTTS